MAKKIKTDHELALNLWDTGNVEAQLLARSSSSPSRSPPNELDKLTRPSGSLDAAEYDFDQGVDVSIGEPDPALSTAAGAGGTVGPYRCVDHRIRVEIRAQFASLDPSADNPT